MLHSVFPWQVDTALKIGTAVTEDGCLMQVFWKEGGELMAAGGPAQGQLLPHHQARGAQAEGSQAGTSRQSLQISVRLLCNTYTVLHDGDI